MYFENENRNWKEVVESIKTTKAENEPITAEDQAALIETIPQDVMEAANEWLLQRNPFTSHYDYADAARVFFGRDVKFYFSRDTVVRDWIYGAIQRMVI